MDCKLHRWWSYKEDEPRADEHRLTFGHVSTRNAALCVHSAWRVFVFFFISSCCCRGICRSFSEPTSAVCCSPCPFLGHANHFISNLYCTLCYKTGLKNCLCMSSVQVLDFILPYFLFCACAANRLIWLHHTIVKIYFVLSDITRAVRDESLSLLTESLRSSGIMSGHRQPVVLTPSQHR